MLSSADPLTDGTHVSEVACLAAAIYAPYKPFIVQYAGFEAEALTQALDNIRLVRVTE